MSEFANPWSWLRKGPQLSASQVAREIDEEIMFHLRSQVEDNLARGLSADEAWANANQRFGCMQQYAKQTWRIDMGHQITVQRIGMLVLVALAVLCSWLWFQVQDLHGQNNQIMQLVQNTKMEEKPTEPTISYPIKMAAGNVREFSKLSIDFGHLQISGDNISVVPISSQPGVTGLVLLGGGKFHFSSDGKTFEGSFHSVLLRFNPKDLDSIIKLDQGKKSNDKGTLEMAKQLLGVVFRHSWHSGMEALIPPSGSFSAALNSQEYGDLLISVADKEVVVYSFSDNKPLYEKK